MDFHKELIAEFDRELVLTRKMLSAIPEDADFTWKAHPKSFSLGRLVGHLAEPPGEWALHTRTTDKLELSMADYKPYIPASTVALLERFDKEAAEARAALAGLD